MGFQLDNTPISLHEQQASIYSFSTEIDEFCQFFSSFPWTSIDVFGRKLAPNCQ